MYSFIYYSSNILQQHKLFALLHHNVHYFEIRKPERFANFRVGRGKEEKPYGRKNPFGKFRLCAMNDLVHYFTYISCVEIALVFLNKTIV